MPELPEVEVCAQYISKQLLDASLFKVTTSQLSLRKPIPKTREFYPLYHQTLKTVSRHGKYLLLNFSSKTIIIHLGMSGTVRIEFKVNKKNHDHCIFSFTKAQNLLHLIYNDPRRFGMISLEGSDALPSLSKLGPDLFNQTQCHPRYLFSKAQKTSVAIKTFLLDQTIVAGVGNIYACEALFTSNIHPATSAQNLSLVQLQTLTKALTTIMKRAIRKGGSSIRTFTNPEGTLGYFSFSHQVYDRAAQPCTMCHTAIEVFTQASRSTYYCPHCQPMLM
ncbi:MAG: bifunctional DNA-formamidopyrimidine glycosylase/DNA-(apurinic or apyrimidinic site) lyase [Methylacidiphilales bacterium]|nr:bifunctional DNA-formamidopyrimidine glycosylase/DNA-(apurinic or apyrimidinic site) lyase [Candidatus Methylacidiphilales bacterium]